MKPNLKRGNHKLKDELAPHPIFSLEPRMALGRSPITGRTRGWEWDQLTWSFVGHSTEFGLYSHFSGSHWRI